MNAPAAPCTVDEVIVAPQAAAAGDSRASPRNALLVLSETLARSPDAGPQRLVEETMRITGAGSAGITLEDPEQPDEIFRWIAVAGEFSRYLNGTMPRHFSPCGEVLLRQRTLVMKDPARHYPYIRDLHAPIRSALLVPFARRGRLVGTLWALAHTPRKQFTTQDAAAVEGLSTFVAALLDTRTAQAGVTAAAPPPPKTSRKPPPSSAG